MAVLGICSEFLARVVMTRAVALVETGRPKPLHGAAAPLGDLLTRLIAHTPRGRCLSSVPLLPA